jgi:GH15 family glucan-1,4-alpha-glucosidase
MAGINSKEELVTIRSTEVLKDCCRENGAIIAANTEHCAYPKDAQSYHYVWPRDAAYVCIALSIVDEYDLQLDYFNWLIERAEGIEKGMLFQNYYTNGRKRWLAFQPDQAGTTLIALSKIIMKGKADKELFDLAHRLSEELVELWQTTNFKHISQDLWEEHFAYPKMQQCFTYSAAIVRSGLLEIGPLIGKNYEKVCEEMGTIVNSAFLPEEKIYIKRTGLNMQKRLDASLLGLVWPGKLKINPEFIDIIAQRLSHKKGIMRYEYDDYDGFRHEGNNARRGAGAWPILTFWIAIAYKLTGNIDKALYYYLLGIDSADEKGYLPEQVFDNDIQSSIKPLAWSHAMQLIARYIIERKEII